jgi:hypothetical protein
MLPQFRPNYVCTTVDSQFLDELLVLSEAPVRACRGRRFHKTSLCFPPCFHRGTQLTMLQSGRNPKIYSHVYLHDREDEDPTRLKTIVFVSEMVCHNVLVENVQKHQTSDAPNNGSPLSRETQPSTRLGSSFGLGFGLVLMLSRDLSVFVCA